MKKVIAIILLLCTFLALCSCGKAETPTVAENTISVTDNTENDKMPTDTEHTVSDTESPEKTKNTGTALHAAVSLTEDDPLGVVNEKIDAVRLKKEQYADAEFTLPKKKKILEVSFELKTYRMFPALLHPDTKEVTDILYAGNVKKFTYLTTEEALAESPEGALSTSVPPIYLKTADEEMQIRICDYEEAQYVVFSYSNKVLKYPAGTFDCFALIQLMEKYRTDTTDGKYAGTVADLSSGETHAVNQGISAKLKTILELSLTVYGPQSISENFDRKFILDKDEYLINTETGEFCKNGTECGIIPEMYRSSVHSYL